MPNHTGPLFLALAALPAAGVTIRVETTPGGPQIVADGKPIPPRMFFGSATAGRVGIGAEWSEVAFEFTPEAEVTGNGTFHFRFGHKAGEVWLADVRITDAAGNDVLKPGSFATSEAFADVWNVWPPGERNTVGAVEVVDGALHVTLRDPAGGEWPDFHLYSDVNLRFASRQTYRCAFRAKASPERPITPSVYRVDAGHYTSIGGPPGQFLEQVAYARDAGVDLVSFSCPNGWDPPEAQENWLAVDSLCRSIIGVNPRVLLVPRVSGNAPTWWLERYPEAGMVWENGKKGGYACVSDRRYRADAVAHLEKLCRHLSETFPDHFAGIHPCGQNTGEWFYEGTWEPPLNGYDPATLAAWRGWLAARGAPDAATAEVPTPAERHAAPFGLLRDPARERRLIDFARFQQEEMADFVVALAAAARRGTEGRKLVVFFYGYHYEFGPVGTGAPVSGHYALDRVLASEDVDIVCSPVSYFDRGWLGTAPCMSPAESIGMAGKLWLNEDDTRTYLSGTPDFGGLENLEQTRSVMRRNTAQAALRGFGTWWMDLPAQGWFADPRIWEEMTLLKPVDEAMLARTSAFRPEVAAIVGQDSMCHLPGRGDIVARPLIYESRAALGRAGAPYGQVMLSDAIAGRVPAKLQVYLAAWSLTAEQRRELAARRPEGVTRVWCYAPGFLLPDRADVAAMEEVTGFRHRLVEPDSAVATPTAAGRGLGLTEPWGPKGRIRPLFAVEATDRETLAIYADGSPAVALRRGPAGLDVFVGPPQLTSELLRVLARQAGVHLFTDVDASVWAAEGYLSVQALADGPLLIHTGRPGAVLDALTGERLGEGPDLALSLQTGETRVLRY